MSIRKTDVEFRLNLQHDAFDHTAQQAFVQHVARVTATDAKEIRILEIREGCVVVKLRLPDEAAKALLEMYWTFMQSEATRDKVPADFRDLLTKYSVEDFTRFKTDITILVTSKPANEAVVFVHGWTGAADTFGEWPQMLWDTQRCDTRVFDYPTGLFTHSPSTLEVGMALRNWVKTHLPNRRLAFVAHSLGGLVVRRFLIAAQDDRDRLDLRVHGIAFVSSPHNGNAMAELAKRLPLMRKAQVNDLSANSATLLDLTLRWQTWVREHVPPVANDCLLMSLYGTADQLVPSVSAVGQSEEVVPVLGKNHTDIVKPKSPSEEIVLTVNRFLRECGFLGGNGEPALDRRGLRANQTFFQEEEQVAAATTQLPTRESTQSKDSGGGL